MTMEADCRRMRTEAGTADIAMLLQFFFQPLQ